MNDELISRAAAFDSVEIFLKQTDAPEVYPGLIPALERVINNVPSAQPEIIRCKDCEHWDTTWQNDFAPNYHYCPMVDGTHRDDFYCADADMRGEQDE